MSTKNQLLTFGLMFLAVSIILKELNATEYPTPPPVPAKFDSPQEVQEYLKQLHNYYMVVGRPRFGKRGYFPEAMPFLKSAQNEDIENKEASSSSPYDISTINQLFQLFDLNGDHSISFSEFKRMFSNNLQ